MTVLTLKTVPPGTKTADLITDTTDIPGVPSVCSDIMKKHKDNTLLTDSKIFSIIKNLTDFNTALKDVDSSSTGDLSSSSNPVNNSVNYDIINTYLTNLEGTIVPFLEHVANCISEANGVPPQALKEQKELTQESLDRLTAIQSPENKSSPYQSWFPLSRPMVQPALFGLFGTALFMLLVSTIIFLRLGGIEIQVIMPMIDFYGIGEFFKSKSGIIMSGVVTGSLISAVGFWMGWFS